MRPHRFQQSEAVPAGQHHVEHHHVGTELRQVPLELCAVRPGEHLVTGRAQPGSDGGPDGVGIFDDQHSTVLHIRHSCWSVLKIG